jgi:arginine exporter protein ArgO
MATEINIPLSKNKLTWIITASIFFIMLCSFMVLKADWIGEDNKAVKVISKYGGIAGVLFFTFTMLQAIKKRKGERIGFSITGEGFYDNSNAANLGLIRWQDIKGFREWTFEGTKCLVVLVDNPKEYIETATGFIIKKMLQANHKGCGSPIVISATSLSITYEKLKDSIIEGYAKFNETKISYKK